MKHIRKGASFLEMRITASGLLTAAGLAGCGATLLGFAGDVSWMLDLFSHFRVQYLIALAAISACLLAMRRPTHAAVFTTFAAVNLWELLPLYLGAPNAPTAGSARLRAMLINVNRDSGVPELVAKTLLKRKPDIVVLLEIDDRWLEALAEPLKAWPHSTVKTRLDNFGIGLFSKFPPRSSKIVYFGGAGVPAIMAELETPAGPLAVFAVHALPPVNAEYFRLRNELYLELANALRQARPPALALGDLNSSPWSAHFKRLLRSSDFADGVRGMGIQPTWPTHNPFMRIPLDHFLHSAGIRVLRKSVGPHVGSDHYPLIVDFELLPAAHSELRGENGLE